MGRGCEGKGWVRADTCCPHSAVACSARLLLLQLLRAALPCAWGHARDVVSAPLRAGGILVAAFEAGCKHLLPHADPEPNPDGPPLAGSLRPAALLSPRL